MLTHPCTHHAELHTYTTIELQSENITHLIYPAQLSSAHTVLQNAGCGVHFIPPIVINFNIGLP